MQDSEIARGNDKNGSSDGQDEVGASHVESVLIPTTSKVFPRMTCKSRWRTDCRSPFEKEVGLNTTGVVFPLIDFKAVSEKVYVSFS